MAGIEVNDLSKDKESKGSHKKLLIIILVVLVAAASAVGGYLYYKHTHKPKYVAKPYKSPLLTDYKNDPQYNAVNDQQKLTIRLNLVSQYAATNDYQKMSDELNQISNDFPKAKNDVNFLMYQFITNYELKKEQDAIASAKAVKASGQPTPVQFTPWKGLIDQYAAK